MFSPIAGTVAILAIAALLMLTERLRADLVALLVVVALGVSGILTPREAFSGFASSAVVTIVSIFILVETLRVTGMTERAGALLLRLGGKSESLLVVTVMIAGAALSLVMNNIAAAAVLLPAISGIVRKVGASPSRLLIPLAFATILGGMATLFTTTNIVASGVLRTQNLPGFGVLDFAPVGLPMVVVGIIYISLWGRRLLPQHPSLSRPTAESYRPDLVEVYRLGERLFRARVPAHSTLIGRALSQTALRQTYQVTVVALERSGVVLPVATPEVEICGGDVLVLQGNLENFRALDVPPYLEILSDRTWRESDLESMAVVMVEVVLAPRSLLLGQTLRATRFREKYGMSVLGIWRAGRPIRTNLGELPLAFGDALLLQGPRQNIALLRTEPDLLVLDNGEAEPPAPQQSRKGWLAAAIMFGVIGLAAFNTALVGELMLAGALLMVLLGIIVMDQAYAAIEWRSVFLVAGMLPLGLAMTNSGAAALIAERLGHLLLPLGPLALLAGLFATATILTQIMPGAAVVAVMAPIAIQSAQQAGLDPRALTMAVALATSMAFMTPLGHPVNVLVMGPGGYRFRDYLRIGGPLTLLLFGVVMVVLPVFWPLTLPR